MLSRVVIVLACLLAAVPLISYGQLTDSLAGKALNVPTKLVGSIQSKTADLDKQLTNKTENYVQKMISREAILRKQVNRLDSADSSRGRSPGNLFSGHPEQQYAALLQKLKSDTATVMKMIHGEYFPYVDSMQGILRFLNTNPQLLGSSKLSPSNVQNALSEVTQLQSKLQTAGEIQQVMQQRQAQIQQWIRQYSHLPCGIMNSYTNYNKELYYYSAQVKAYKDALNDPDKVMQMALTVLARMPAFTAFMQKNSMLAGIFGLSGTYSPGAVGQGLPSRDDVVGAFQNQAVQNPAASKVGTVSSAGSGTTGQIASGQSQLGQNPPGQTSTSGLPGAQGPGGQDGPDVTGLVQQKMQSAQDQVDQLTAKVASFGGAGGADIDIPNFQPNGQKTKSFLHRFQIGFNIQTVHSTLFYPSTSDIALSLGYKLNDQNVVGVGASYKIGWGQDISHISVTSQGVGLRSFVDIHLKKSFFVSGGFEYNYQQPFRMADWPALKSWQPSGLIGLSKTISMKTKFLKQTKFQLLWDFLSYQQVPKAQPFLFRVGYNF